jgi:hypothetical protein
VSQAWRGDLLRLGAVLSAAAAVVHLSVARVHFDEYWLFGVLFVASGVLQLAWAVLIWRRRDDRRLLVAGLALQLGIVVVWVASRTTGLPDGPERWKPESVGPLDAVCSLDEVLIVVLGAVAVRAARRRRGVVDGLEAFALIATAGTWFLLAAGAGHGH